MVELLGALTQSSICTKANQFKLCGHFLFLFFIFHFAFLSIFMSPGSQKVPKPEFFPVCVTNTTYESAFGDVVETRNPRPGQEIDFGRRYKWTPNS